MKVRNFIHKKYSLVSVTWLDSYTSDDDDPISDFFQISVGWLTAENPTYIRITQNLARLEPSFPHMYILKKNIIKINKIRYPNESKLRTEMDLCSLQKKSRV